MRKYFLLLSFFVGSEATATVKNTVVNPILTASTPSPTIPDRLLKYYEIDKKEAGPIYTQKMQFKKLPTGETSTQITVSDVKGNVVYTENIISRGSHLISQIGDHLQSKRHLEVIVKDDRVFLKTGPLATDTSEKKEKVKENSEKLPEHFITGPVCEAFLIEHFNELMADDTVYAKVGILDIREVIGFKFWKKQMTKINDRDVVVIGMKPASIFFSLLVDTIYIYIDVKDKKFVKYVGRTPLWKEVKDDLKPLDAEIVFD